MSTDWSKLNDALLRQKEYSDSIFDHTLSTEKQKEEQLKTLALALHAEVTGICEGTNFKDHKKTHFPVNIPRILYKSADAYRYVLAILNLWDIDEKMFTDALSQKDDFLHYRKMLNEKSWSGQPIALFDMDDVLAEFRTSFCNFVTKETGRFIDPLSNEYYNASAFKQHGIGNEEYIRKFTNSHGFLNIELNQKYYNLMKQLKDRGFWIQIVTARASKNETCFYDTYSWLMRHNVPADSVAFATEKFIWYADQDFYAKSPVIAIDDAPKHAAEYVKHGVPTVVPQKTYNEEVKNIEGVQYVLEHEDPLPKILSVLKI